VRFFSCLMEVIEELWPSCSVGNCALTAREDSLERTLPCKAAKPETQTLKNGVRSWKPEGKVSEFVGW
jgi:hypothetical protein